MPNRGRQTATGDVTDVFAKPTSRLPVDRVLGTRAVGLRVCRLVFDPGEACGRLSRRRRPSRSTPSRPTPPADAAVACDTVALASAGPTVGRSPQPSTAQRSDTEPAGATMACGTVALASAGSTVNQRRQPWEEEVPSPHTREELSQYSRSELVSMVSQLVERCAQARQTYVDASVQCFRQSQQIADAAFERSKLERMLRGYTEPARADPGVDIQPVGSAGFGLEFRPSTATAGQILPWAISVEELSSYSHPALVSMHDTLYEHCTALVRTCAEVRICCRNQSQVIADVAHACDRLVCQLWAYSCDTAECADQPAATRAGRSSVRSAAASDISIVPPDTTCAGQASGPTSRSSLSSIAALHEALSQGISDSTLVDLAVVPTIPAATAIGGSVSDVSSCSTRVSPGLPLSDAPESQSTTDATDLRAHVPTMNAVGPNANVGTSVASHQSANLVASRKGSLLALLSAMHPSGMAADDLTRTRRRLVRAQSAARGASAGSVRPMPTPAGGRLRPNPIESVSDESTHPGPMPVTKRRKPDTTRTYRVERLMATRCGTAGPEYLVKWAGYDCSDMTWEPVCNILDPYLIEEFDRSCA